MKIHDRICRVDALLWKRHDPAVSDTGLGKSVAEAFGRKLFAARERAGLTQEELGYLSSIHRTEISQLERGYRSPRLDTVVKLAGALEVEPCELIGDVRWTPPPTGPAKGGFRSI
jgi:DNA-binding XRE family transcriptional regulator